jgi:hypothetical protein
MSGYDQLKNEFLSFMDAAINIRSKETVDYLRSEERKVEHPESVVGEALFKMGFRATDRVSDIIEAVERIRHDNEQAYAILSTLKEEWADYQRTIYYHPDVFARFFQPHMGIATGLDNDVHALRCFELKVTLVNMCNNELWLLASRRLHGTHLAVPHNPGRTGQTPILLGRIRSAIQAGELAHMQAALAAGSRKRTAAAMSAAASADEDDLIVSETHQRHNASLKEDVLSILHVTRGFLLAKLDAAKLDWYDVKLKEQLLLVTSAKKIHGKIREMVQTNTQVLQAAIDKCQLLASSPFSGLAGQPHLLFIDAYCTLCTRAYTTLAQKIHTAISKVQPSDAFDMLHRVMITTSNELSKYQADLTKYTTEHSVGAHKQKKTLTMVWYFNQVRDELVRTFETIQNTFTQTLQSITEEAAHHAMFQVDMKTPLSNTIDHLRQFLNVQVTASGRDRKSIQIETRNKMAQLCRTDGLPLEVSGETVQTPSIFAMTFPEYSELIRLSVLVDIINPITALLGKLDNAQTAQLRARGNQEDSVFHADSKRMLLEIISNDIGRASSYYTPNTFAQVCPNAQIILQQEQDMVRKLDLGKNAIVLKDGEQAQFTAVRILQDYKHYIEKEYNHRAEQLPRLITYPVPVISEPTVAEAKTLYMDWFVDRDEWIKFAELCAARIPTLSDQLGSVVPMTTSWLAIVTQMVRHSKTNLQPKFQQSYHMMLNLLKAEMVNDLRKAITELP